MMRCPAWIIVTLMMLVMPASAPGAAGEDARRFVAAAQAYRQGDYDAAIAGFSELVQSGIPNPKLYYNLGNAYLKKGDLGPSLLWYEKALQSMPRDPDLRFNIQYARSLTRDARDPEGTSLPRILFFWKYRFSAAAVIFAALVCNAVFWITAGAYRLSRKRPFKAAALAVLVPTMILVLTAGFNYYAAAHSRQAIILPDRVTVRAGLESTSTALFDLHAGARVDVIKQLKDHCQIYFSENKLGWVSKDALGLI